MIITWKSIGLAMAFLSQFESFDPTPLTFDPRPLRRVLVWHPNETYGWMQYWKMHILDLVWSRYDHFSGRYCENKNFGFSVTLTMTFDLDSPKTTGVYVGPWPTSEASLVMIAETVWLLQGKQTHKQTDRQTHRMTHTTDQHNCQNLKDSGK